MSKGGARAPRAPPPWVRPCDHEAIRDEGVPSEPSLLMTYDCLTRTVNVYIEWIGKLNECVLASLSIDFGKVDYENCSWQLHNYDILCTTQKLQSQQQELNKFNEALSKIEFQWVIFKSYSFFII